MRNKDRKMTSVKLHTGLHRDLKEVCEQTAFSFRKLAEAAIFHYLTDDKFRKKMHNTVVKYPTPNQDQYE